MLTFGISDLADATASDRLGLPVVSSIRRSGKTVRLHFGKGLSLDEASTGALMEAVEFAVAENESARGPDLWLSTSELCAALPSGLTIGDFAPRLGVAPPQGQRMPAVYCEEIISRTEVLLPAELVLVPYPLGGETLFGWSTNGLASGNTLDEATLHALLEIIERDSLAMNIARNDSHIVRNASLPPPFQQLFSKWHTLGIELTVRFLPNQFELPCFEAVIREVAYDDLQLVRGWGCHLDSRIALSRAVCEAAQSRIAVMEGRRRKRGRRPNAPTGHAKPQQMPWRATTASKAIDFAAVPTTSHTSVQSAMRDLQVRLADVGITRVFRRRMHYNREPEALLGLHVVKVVVPYCETAVGTHVRIGPRLWKRVAERAGA